MTRRTALALRGVPGWCGLLVVGAVLGHPSPGQAQTPTGKPKPADPAVGTWQWIGTKRDGSSELRKPPVNGVSAKTIILRSDGTMLWTYRDTDKQDTPTDTAVCTQKLPWGRSANDSIWSRDPGFNVATIEGQQLVWGHIEKDVYERVDSLAPLKNSFHPRRAPAPRGKLAELVGTWEWVSGTEMNLDFNRTRGPDLLRETLHFRPDMTWERIQLHKDGTDTLSCARVRTGAFVGDTLWWTWGLKQSGALSEKIGLKIVVQDQQLSIFNWNAPTEPLEVYKRVAAPKQP